MDTLPLHPAQAAVLERLKALSPEKSARYVGVLQRECKARKLYYKKDYQPLGLTPFVLPSRLVPTLEALTRTIYRFQLKAPVLFRERAMGFPDLIRLERRTAAWFARYGDRDPRPWELLIRPDYGLRRGPDGRLTPVLYEFNSCMLGGIYLHSESLEIVEKHGLPGLGLDSRRLGITPSPHLLGFLRRWVHECRRRAGHAGDGGLAFLESLPPGGGFSELPRITHYFQSLGDTAKHGDARALELRNGRICLRGMPVAYAYRDFSFEDVSGPDNPRMRAFGQLWRERRVAPTFASDFDQKGILECLTSRRFESLFSRREVALLREHVPWTRVAAERHTESPEGRRVDLMAYAASHRESLVLKPSWESGGEGIRIGWKTPQSRWERALDRALKTPGGWSVQGYLALPKIETGYLRGGKIHVKACRATVGVFHDGSQFAFHARVSPKDIVNVAQGGALSAVYLG